MSVEQDERRSTRRAIFFLVLAATLVVLLIATMGGTVDDAYEYARSLWGGLMIGAIINFLPAAHWLQTTNFWAALIDDEGAREHRRSAMAAGFRAAILVALVLVVLRRSIGMVSGYDSVRIVATAAMAAALTRFAVLELRAMRG